MVCDCLLFEVVDVLLDRHSRFLGVGFDLLALPGLELLGRHASFLRFLGDLGLHGCDLLRRRLRTWHAWVGWCRHGVLFRVFVDGRKMLKLLCCQ